MIDHFHHGRVLLTHLESTMKNAGLWSATRPSARALASEKPFACDTLAFEQWLQFLFIPRLTTMLETQQLAPPMSLLPMAEISWQEKHKAAQQVLRDFDQWSQLRHE